MRKRIQLTTNEINRLKSLVATDKSVLAEIRAENAEAKGRIGLVESYIRVRTKKIKILTEVKRILIRWEMLWNY